MTQYDETDSQLDVRVKKATERISENIHIVANEPSLAFYRLQEHVRKALPPMVEKRVEVTKLHHELQGRCYDVEYAVSAVRSIHNADASFLSIQELLRNALFFKQQLKYKESLKTKESTSVYKRLSAHITIDLPDLPELSDALRETASKVESMMAQARTASLSTNDENF
ncbi:BLOC-1-related complex subunit 8 homolog isoform X1 [Halyomorpha halys]|uniref:BLOC-1-related complex subunit 8 homolog isoform X1 n=1 Tax=Halyomorpha halys TaxID=286706 RepID=UPI0006D50295|nr:BLOC-1-related complex subunit 8 homolog isoform X1 [Halyomorpha halys]